MENSEHGWDQMNEDIERDIAMAKNTNGTANGRGGNTTEAENGQAKNVPVHTVRICGIKAAVWKNNTTNGPMYNTTLIRTYKNQQGEWAESHSLSRDDLLTAMKALDLAHTFIVETEAQARAQQQSESE